MADDAKQLRAWFGRFLDDLEGALSSATPSMSGPTDLDSLVEEDLSGLVREGMDPVKALIEAHQKRREALAKDPYRRKFEQVSSSLHSMLSAIQTARSSLPEIGDAPEDTQGEGAPGDVDRSAEPYERYKPVLHAVGIPDGGDDTQILAKASDGDGVVEWVDHNGLPAGADGDLLWHNGTAWVVLNKPGGNGTYWLKCVVTEGDPEFSWVQGVTWACPE